MLWKGVELLSSMTEPLPSDAASVPAVLETLVADLIQGYKVRL